MNAPEYIPFPQGSGSWNFQWGVRRRLFYTDTHLLIIENLGFTEVYSRIYYKDIRYLVTTPSYAQEIIGAVFGLGLLACLGLFLALLQIPYAYFVPVFIAVPLLILFIINIAMGTSCNCYLGTPAQSIRIPKPNRYKQIPGLIEFLRNRGVQEAFLQ